MKPEDANAVPSSKGFMKMIFKSQSHERLSLIERLVGATVVAGLATAAFTACSAEAGATNKTPDVKPSTTSSAEATPDYAALIAKEQLPASLSDKDLATKFVQDVSDWQMAGAGTIRADYEKHVSSELDSSNADTRSNANTPADEETFVEQVAESNAKNVFVPAMFGKSAVTNPTTEQDTFIKSSTKANYSNLLNVMDTKPGTTQEGVANTEEYEIATQETGFHTVGDNGNQRVLNISSLTQDNSDKNAIGKITEEHGLQTLNNTKDTSQVIFQSDGTNEYVQRVQSIPYIDEPNE